jgi:Ca2+-binding EF-hand superfamily protein
LFDSDGSGSISSSELKAVVQALGIAANPNEIKELMKLMDTDGKCFFFRFPHNKFFFVFVPESVIYLLF